MLLVFTKIELCTIKSLLGSKISAPFLLYSITCVCVGGGVVYDVSLAVFLTAPVFVTPTNRLKFPALVAGGQLETTATVSQTIDASEGMSQQVDGVVSLRHG